MIYDLVIQKLRGQETVVDQSLDAFRFSDHLLPRVGLVQVLNLTRGSGYGPERRKRSDELWVLVRGSCRFRCHDERANSPTSGGIHEVEADEPSRLLVPFGVTLTITCLEEALVLRFASYDGDNVSGDPEPRWKDV